MSDEELLEYFTFVPKVDDLIERFDSILATGINHLITVDVTHTLVSFNLTQPEAADWPKKVLPYLREKNQ